MASVEELQQLRQRLAERIKAERDPKKKAAYQKRLDETRAQINQAKKAAVAPPEVAPPVVEQTPGVGFNQNLNTPQEVINAQAGVNEQTANQNWQGNNPNQTITPDGTQTISRDENGNVTVNQKLSDENQRTRDLEVQNNQGYLNLANDLVGQYKANPFNETGLDAPDAFNTDGLPEMYELDQNKLGGMPQYSMDGAPQIREFNLEGLPEAGKLDYSDLGAMPTFSTDGLPDLTNDFSADRQRIEDTIYKRKEKRLNERYGQEEQQFAQSLADRGATPGSEQYEQQMKSFRQSKSDTYDDAASSAVEMGGQEQANMYGMASDRRQQGVNERLTGFNAGMQGRGQKIGEKLNLFNSANETRSNAIGERQSDFTNSLTNRQNTGAERMDGFNTGMQGRQQGWSEQMDRYNTTAANRNQQMNERQAKYGNDMNRYQTRFGNRLTASQQPLEALGKVMGNYTGYQKPQFQQYAGYNMQNTDVSGVATQYQGWNQANQNREDDQAWQSGEAAITRRANQQLANQARSGGGGGGRGRGGGGGMSPADKLAYEKAQYDQKLAYYDQLQQRQPKAPSSGSQWGNALAGLVGNVGSTLANGWAENYWKS